MAGRIPGQRELSGKVAIVTGGARGLGLTTAEAYLRAGARVAIFDRDEAALATIAAVLAAAGHEPLTLAVDIRDQRSVGAGVQRVLDSCGRVDVLVNNAAVLMRFIAADAPERPNFWEVDPDRWRELWDINVTGTWLCCREVALEMIRARRGSIINLTTSLHTMRSALHIPYGPSKAAIDAFTEAGAKQLEPYGVRMNALLPGAAVNPRGEADPNLNPSDVIVPAAVFLASDASARVTGQSVIADEFNREAGILPAGSPRAD